MNGDKEARLVRQIKAINRMCNRAHFDSITMARKIARLANQDVKSLCPDHYEEIMALMDRCDGVLEFLLSHLRQLLRLAQENDMNMPEVQKIVYQMEDLKRGLVDLRLTIMSWVRQFEGIPSETEKLEELMSLPTEEEVEAEKAEAYRTGGLNLLKKEDGEASRP